MRVAIFASGAGSNAERLIEHAKHENALYTVVLVLSNKAEAGVADVARKHQVEFVSIVHDTNEAEVEKRMLQYLDEHQVELICLAGYLRKIPDAVIARYPARILNIHPSLLPKFGGKGMYGKRVFEAVLNVAEKETGVTVHLVDSVYDSGAILKQERIPIEVGESIQSLEQKTHKIEHKMYPEVVDFWIDELQSGAPNPKRCS